MFQTTNQLFLARYWNGLGSLSTQSPPNMQTGRPVTSPKRTGGGAKTHGVKQGKTHGILLDVNPMKSQKSWDTMTNLNLLDLGFP